MAQFYAEIQGNRGKSSRMGTKNSGMWAHVRGWDSGVRVECRHDEKRGIDQFYVYLTAGSNGNGREIPVGIAEILYGKVTWIACQNEGTIDAPQA